MKVSIKQFDCKYDKTILYFMIIPLIIIGKIIRYTILKSTLVDPSIGHSMLQNIIVGNVHLSLLENVEDTLDASGNAAFFLSFIYKFGCTTYRQYEIFITIFWNVIIIILLRKCQKRLTFYQIIFGMICITALNIWCFNLAKEPVQIIYFILIFYIICSRRLTTSQKYFGVLLIVILAVLTFRTYYILIIYFMIVVWICFHLFTRRKEKNGFLTFALILIIIGISYYLFLRLSSILFPSSYAEMVRVRTRSVVGNTRILNIFSSSNLIFLTCDYLLVIIRMLFPLELLRLGLKYTIYAVIQILMSMHILMAIRYHTYMNKSSKIALYFVLGFLLASASFEADFGTWIRHEVTAFPLYLITSNMVKISFDKANKFKIAICFANVKILRSS